MRARDFIFLCLASIPYFMLVGLVLLYEYIEYPRE